MRSKDVILRDGLRTDLLTLEVLLDIRDLISKEGKIIPKRGRPKGSKNKRVKEE